MACVIEVIVMFVVGITAFASFVREMSPSRQHARTCPPCPRGTR